MRAAIALAVALAAVGCYHDKYNVAVPPKEEYKLPPDEKRYNEPDTATYRKPPPTKQEETLMNRDRVGRPGPGGGLGGF
ncbi:MAG: hypothetical protein L0241_29720 [Planctomycetia bacterium]|nr:hypothetical protein [Planctomycetia bacterium]